MKKEQLGIYIHIPFCVKKCYYCDFLSSPESEETKDCYVNRLLEEIEEETSKDVYNNHLVHTIFFGGGTPSILPSKQIEKILCKLRENFFIKQDAEITIEVNPGTVTKDKLEDYFSMGINRLSIGLQSANDEELKTLGRIHTYQEFLSTYQMARTVGFSNINVDLMSALPGQTIQSWLDTLTKIMELKVEHISAYSLIVEEETPFFQQYGGVKKTDNKTENKTDYIAESQTEFPALPDEDTEREMYELTDLVLKQHGFYAYEISNYAQKGFECQHNSSYWRRNDYIGFGIGAASLVNNIRRSNIRHLEDYINQLQSSSRVNKEYIDKDSIQVLSVKEQMEEFMFLGLRMMEGVSKRDFFHKFHQSLDEVYGKIVEDFLKKELLLEDKDSLLLTKKGIDLSNYVMAEFLF